MFLQLAEMMLKGTLLPVPTLAGAKSALKLSLSPFLSQCDLKGKENRPGMELAGASRQSRVELSSSRSDCRRLKNIYAKLHGKERKEEGTI